MNSTASFPHHDYFVPSPQGAYDLIDSQQAIPISSPNHDDVAVAVDRFRRHKVTEIVLLHGTFAGDDMLGVTRELSRLSSRLALNLKSIGKQVFDQLAGDVGNYTDDFASQLSRLLSVDGQAEILAHRLTWSGENHHLGRASGAIRLIRYLMGRDYDRDCRVQIWGHSHGGNVMAMAGQLLAAGPAELHRFFDATRMHYRNPMTGAIDLPEWAEVQALLLDDRRGRYLPKIDCVTFGTPLRYRWNSRVHSKLLHFVQHRRTAESTDDCTTLLPSSVRELIAAVHGDYVQHLGIGGTDFLHSIFAPRSWIPERRVRKMFADKVRRRDLKKCLNSGHRVSADGKTLLVQYADCDDQWNRKLLGHGVYTCREWLAFHLNTIGQYFYSEA